MQFTRCLLTVVLAAVLCGCTGLKRVVRVPNSFQVLPADNPALSARVRHHLERFVFSPAFQRRGLEFSGDVLVKTVPAVRRDRLGVPFWAPRGRAADRSGGLTLFTGRSRPVVVIIAIMADGTWDDRTLKHECCHVVLLWNGITGHPPEFRAHAPLWD